MNQLTQEQIARITEYRNEVSQKQINELKTLNKTINKFVFGVSQLLKRWIRPDVAVRIASMHTPQSDLIDFSKTKIEKNNDSFKLEFFIHGYESWRIRDEFEIREQCRYVAPENLFRLNDFKFEVLNENYSDFMPGITHWHGDGEPYQNSENCWCVVQVNC